MLRLVAPCWQQRSQKTYCSMMHAQQLGALVQAFRAVVGRSYRVVDRWDIVPSLPPFEDYAPLPFPLWIQVGRACFYPCG